MLSAERHGLTYDGVQGFAMQIEATRKRFSVEEYYRMAEAGVIGPEERVELIDGEIIQMTAMGSRHIGCVNRMTDLFGAALRGRTVVSPQHPVRLDDFTEPQPDIALLRFRADFYSSKTPAAADALLVVEISDTSLRYDRNVKLPRYAAAGVPEAWIVDLEAGRLLVHRDPSGDGYGTALTLGRGEEVRVAAFPEVVFKAADLLGE